MMRTTLTLEDDVAGRVEEAMQRTGKSFKQTVNEALRAGLALRHDAGPIARFVVRARPLGVVPGLDYSRTAELLEVAEGPDHR